MSPRPRSLSLALILWLNAATLLAQALPEGDPRQLGFSPDRLDRIGRVMQDYVDSGRVAGVVTLVARHGQIAYLRAFGWADREAGIRMAPDALFRIASQTKALTSVAVMALVEEGRLRLSDPVATYLPSFANSRVAILTDTGRALVPANRAITIRDLLTHTAGISYGTDSLVRDLYAAQGLGPAAGFGWYFADKKEPICASMDRLGSLPFVAQPGKRWVYGYNTDILGCVVERVSGMTLAEFFRQRITEPLGMTSTWFYVPRAQRARLTAVYAATADGGYRRAPDTPRGQGDYLDGPRLSYSGGAGLIATAGDYAVFLQMLLDQGRLRGRQILAPATVSLMTTNQVDTLFSRRGTGFGLGFQTLDDPGLAGQYGGAGVFSWGGAYASTYWVDPANDLVAVFMIQLIPARGLDLSDKFRTLVYQAMVEDYRP
ncbi:MAG: serine hydrolase domain-containing protein [Gemmatimonadales bacterium]